MAFFVAQSLPLRVQYDVDGDGDDDIRVMNHPCCLCVSMSHLE